MVLGLVVLLYKHLLTSSKLIPNELNLVLHVKVGRFNGMMDIDVYTCF